MPVEGTFLQYHRGDFRPEETRKLSIFSRVGELALACEDIIQFPAVVADHGLNCTMQAAVLAARNFRAILTQRTFE